MKSDGGGMAKIVKRLRQVIASGLFGCLRELRRHRQGQTPLTAEHAEKSAQSSLRNSRIEPLRFIDQVAGGWNFHNKIRASGRGQEKS
jgi:hypothetical protein